jgi:hypothetical protein
LLENSLYHTRADTQLPANLEYAVASGLQSRIRASTAAPVRRRPSFVPFALARARPALTQVNETIRVDSHIDNLAPSKNAAPHGDNPRKRRENPGVVDELKLRRSFRYWGLSGRGLFGQQFEPKL